MIILFTRVGNPGRGGGFGGHNESRLEYGEEKITSESTGKTVCNYEDGQLL